MGWIIVIVGALLVILFRSLSKVKKRVKTLEEQANKFRELYVSLKGVGEGAKAREPGEETAAPVQREQFIFTPVETPPLRPELTALEKPPWRPELTALEKPPVHEKAHKEEVPPSGVEVFVEGQWRRIERKLIENWTGILGAVILVAGFTFLGIYTALRMEPFFRFLMVVAASAALVAPSFLLRRREQWQQFALWLRSSGAAVFLFACAASGSLPGLGLQWLYEPLPAFGLLFAGMAVNLYLGYAGGTQTFASLHVVLSLLPLFIVPQSMTVLLIASFVALYGVILSLRGRWDVHLFVTLVAYALYHGFWYFRMGPAADLDERKVTGALCAVAVAAGAALVHYRKDYRSVGVEELPLFVHILNWVLLGTALLVYTSGTSLRGAVLSAFAVAAYYLARRGLRLGIRWLYLTDTLIAQAFAVAAIFSFYHLVPNLLFLVSILFLETALFLRLIIDEREELLSRTGVYMLHGATALLALVGLYKASEIAPLLERYQNALILVAALSAAAIMKVFAARKRRELLMGVPCYGWVDAPGFDALTVFGGLHGLLAMAAVSNLYGTTWMGTAALVIIGSLMFLSYRFSLKGVAIGALGASFFTQILSWVWLSKNGGISPQVQLACLAPIAALSAIAVRYPPAVLLRRPLRHLAIYGLGLHLLASAHLLFHGASPLMPGILWLMLSLVALEISNRLSEENAPPVLHLGYLYLFCFILSYFQVVLQTHAYLGVLRVRTLIEAFALAVIVYWWLYRPREGLKGQTSWTHVHPFFLELALGFLVTIIIVEVASAWRPVVWALLALLFLADLPAERLDSRFRFYSLLFYWASAVEVVAVISTFQTPSPRWFDQPGVTGLLAIGLQVAYIIRSHRSLPLGDIRFPRGAEILHSWGLLIDARRPYWIYYPFFATVALFIYWRFDRSFLTLLWSVEAFTVFVLSVILRENHFRYMSLGALGVCLFRLVVFDMARSDLIIRGFVFIGVGLLMLAMNAVYNKYRARFQ